MCIIPDYHFCNKHIILTTDFWCCWIYWPRESEPHLIRRPLETRRGTRQIRTPQFQWQAPPSRYSPARKRPQRVISKKVSIAYAQSMGFQNNAQSGREQGQNPPRKLNKRHRTFLRSRRNWFMKQSMAHGNPRPPSTRSTRSRTPLAVTT